MQIFECKIHGKFQNLLCGADCCHYIMCEDCVFSHRLESGHSIFVKFNKSSLNFFTTFVGYIHYKIYDLISNVRKQGYRTLFSITRQFEDKNNKQIQQNIIKGITIQVIQFYQQLMKFNRQFVISNMENENIFHPQFLKDLFNMIVYPWSKNSTIIQNNFNQKISTILPIKGKLKIQIIQMIQKQRLQHLKHFQHNIIVNIDKYIQKQQFNKEQISLHGFDQYQIPWSVVQVQSQQQFQNINQAEILIKDQKISDQSFQKDKHYNVNLLLAQISKLKKQNMLLKSQNQRLRNNLLINNQRILPKSTSNINLTKRKSYYQRVNNTQQYINSKNVVNINNSLQY